LSKNSEISPEEKTLDHPGAAVASLTRQISTSLATVLYRTIKCVAYRQASPLWQHSSQKNLKPSEIWRLIFEKTGTFRQKFGSESPFGRYFSPQKEKKRLMCKSMSHFISKFKILLEEYLSYR
jgi:hypothetical protein